MIDLTLSDSDEEIIGLGASNPQQKQPVLQPKQPVLQPQQPVPQKQAAAGVHRGASPALLLDDSDSDDDKPLHQIKAEIIQQHSQQQQQSSQQQQPSQQAASQQQQQQPQEQKRPPARKLISKKVAAAAAASQSASAAAAGTAPLQDPPSQQHTQHSPSPTAAATAAAGGECDKENTSPAAGGLQYAWCAAAGAAAAAAAGGSGGSGGITARQRRKRRSPQGFVPINFDDLDIDLGLDVNPDSCQNPNSSKPDSNTDRGLDDDEEGQPLHKQSRPQQQQQQQPCQKQQQQRQQAASQAGSPAPTAAAAAAAAAAAGGGCGDSDDDVVLCWEPPPPPRAAAAAAAGSSDTAAAAAGRKRRQQQDPAANARKRSPSAAAAAAAGGADVNDDFDDLWGLGGLADLAPDDSMWEPPPHTAAAAAAGGGSSSGDTAAAAAADGWGDNWCDDESDDSYGGGAGRRGPGRSRQQPTARQRSGSSSRGTAAAAAAAGSSGGGGGGSKVRMSAEERAAERAAERVRKAAEKAAEKERKAADKIAAKLAKAAEAQALKDAKRMDAFINRKINGRFGEYECVLVMDGPTSTSTLGLAVSSELERRKTIAWQVVPALPLSGRWSGCCCFTFKRRKLCERDEHALKTAVSARVDVVHEDVSGAPPYVQLVFESPSVFLQQLTADGLTGLLSAVRGSHPHCSLGVLVLGLRQHTRRVETQGLRQGGVGGVGVDWRRVSQQLLSLHLTTPGLQLRLITKQEEAAAHLINTARALGQQPYTAESQLEAFGGSGPGASSKAVGATMSGALGPITTDFAVKTLGKMHGMGGHKAWAIAEAYPSFGALISAFERAKHTPGVQPGLLLADLTEPEASGKAKPRRVGPTMSKRLHLLLTSEDPDAIVEAAGEAAD